MFNYNYNTLCHHGIKGQKWGVRRFQNEDGTLTKAGEERYYKSNGKRKSNHRIKLEDKYIAKGYSVSDAEKRAKGRIIAENTLVAVGVAAVTAATIVAIRNRNKEKIDQVIKKGTGNFQRVDEAQETLLKRNMEKKNLHDVFYMTDNSFDNKNYEQIFSDYDSKLIKMSAKKDFKIASQDAARKAFVEVNKENPLPSDIYRKSFRGGKVPYKYIEKFRNGEKVPKRIEKQMYENFNINIVTARRRGTDVVGEYNRFYDNLKKKGYSGVQDINDLKISKLRAKNPLIVFDKSVVKIDKLDTPKVTPAAVSEARKSMDKLIFKNTLEKNAPKILGGAGVFALGGVSISSINANKTNKAEKYVLDYLDKHPNTKLTTFEIKRMYENNK